MKASVSAIIPCFRCSDTIERALQSVADQTQLPAEVLLIDDASRDSTIDRLIELKNRYEPGWIKIIKSEYNSGPAAARNRGWEQASSELIAFLDADDAWSKKKIEIQYSWMKSHPGVAMTGHRCFISANGVIHEPPGGDFAVRSISPRYLLLTNKFLTPSVMLYRKIPYRFVETQRTSEDYMLWLQIVLDGYKTSILNTSLATLFKPGYGLKGLSSRMREMELGELQNYRRLYSDKKISFPHYHLFRMFSIIKYSRRMLITAFRKKGAYS